MIKKLEEIKGRFEEIGQLLVQPDLVKDQKKFTQLSKEYRDLEKVVVKYKAYQDILKGVKFAKEVLEKEKDQELREMAKLELDELVPKREAIEEDLKMQLMPRDPNDSKNAVLEIRAGTGGDEAAIFAG
ncbi:MAG TPA: PCRF domain-containing protein, partial [Cyclobacteriaceae bacterium]|nr:PCRF domain-containing protein [Cyclobacteriaceae bacterium]